MGRPVRLAGLKPLLLLKVLLTGLFFSRPSPNTLLWLCFFTLKRSLKVTENILSHQLSQTWLRKGRTGHRSRDVVGDRSGGKTDRQTDGKRSSQEAGAWMTTDLSIALPPASFSFSLVRDDGGAEGPQGGNGRGGVYRLLGRHGLSIPLGVGSQCSAWIFLASANLSLHSVPRGDL